MLSAICNSIFGQAIADYHLQNKIDLSSENPYKNGSIEFLLYAKCWIDTQQWHMEDEVRDPEITPQKGLEWKRRIDQSNQDRTDVVEYIDSYFLQQFIDVKALPDARLNTESPAWAIDRLSILALKIFHMGEETGRTHITEEHRQNCLAKLHILLEQQKDLSLAIDELLADIAAGKKYMKVYRQMKM
ncbi:MAG: DUF4254 domain-containing protein, partial [Mucilaginibacter polytrichastri]|nr:DUF4254 domain-containing protein [Mucilaginibacter polytrichastri]